MLCGLAILLFPDGRLPSRRWRWALWAYLAASAMFMANEFIGQSTVFTVRHLRVDVTGSPVNNPDPAGFLAHAARVTGFALLVIVALWVCFVARQAVSYRRATGERRQQPNGRRAAVPCVSRASWSPSGRKLLRRPDAARAALAPILARTRPR